MATSWRWSCCPRRPGHSLQVWWHPGVWRLVSASVALGRSIVPCSFTAIIYHCIAAFFYPKKICFVIYRADIVDNQDVHVESPADEDEPVAQLGAAPAPRPTGKIVGVVRRNWRPYCGMLETREDMKVPIMQFSMYYVCVWCLFEVTPSPSATLNF